MTVTRFTEGEGLSNNTIMTVYSDQNGNIWFGSNGGGAMKFRTSSFKTYTDVQSLGTRAIRGIEQASDGKIWLVADGSGLIRYDGQSFYVYNESVGFPSNSIYCMLIDPKGLIWYGTRGKGIGVFNPHSQIAKTYDLAAEGYNGNVRTITSAKNGDLWMGHVWRRCDTI